MAFPLRPLFSFLFFHGDGGQRAEGLGEQDSFPSSRTPTSPRSEMRSEEKLTITGSVNGMRRVANKLSRKKKNSESSFAC